MVQLMSVSVFQRQGEVTAMTLCASTLCQVSAVIFHLNIHLYQHMAVLLEITLSLMSYAMFKLHCHK